MKRYFSTFSMIIFLAFFILPSFCYGATVFEPKQYIRTTGEPDVYSDAFQATAGPATLIVTNGTSSGDDRVEDSVSSAWVLVNDIEIFGPNDFNPNVYYLEADIDLLENNTLYVELNSKPNSYITIEIRQGGLAPVILNFNALPSTILPGESSKLIWNTSGADACHIEPGIGSVPSTGSFIVSPTITQSYILTATGAGGAASETITVTVGSNVQSFTSSCDYDANGELIHVDAVKDDQSDHSSTDYTYDDVGNRIAKTTDKSTP